MKHLNSAAKYIVIVGAGVLVLFLAAHMAQPIDAESSNAPQLIRSANHDKADAPSGRLILRVPSMEENDGSERRSELSTPPAEPSEPESEDDGGNPTFFGEKVGKNVLWVLDCSNSMRRTVGEAMETVGGNIISNPTRLDVVKAETVRTLREISSDTQFDIIQLAGSAVDYVEINAKAELPVTSRWQGALVQCDDATRNAAIDFVTNMTTWFGTPTSTALKVACTEYGKEIDTLFFLTDGDPTWFDIPEIHTTTMKINEKFKMATSHVLEKFPAWYGPLASDCELVCIQIGPSSTNFTENLAAENGGKFIHLAE